MYKHIYAYVMHAYVFGLGEAQIAENLEKLFELNGIGMAKGNTGSPRKGIAA